eukprot:snap_masked-scaffold_21-processed-gene-1.14-mRNA-1 protein AED:1.00 eAED:1.00 QI:0/-1/0/0/-1/1/1/0/173
MENRQSLLSFTNNLQPLQLLGAPQTGYENTFSLTQGGTGTRENFLALQAQIRSISEDLSPEAQSVSSLPGGIGLNQSVMIPNTQLINIRNIGVNNSQHTLTSVKPLEEFWKRLEILKIFCSDENLSKEFMQLSYDLYFNKGNINKKPERISCNRLYKRKLQQVKTERTVMRRI